MGITAPPGEMCTYSQRFQNPLQLIPICAQHLIITEAYFREVSK